MKVKLRKVAEGIVATVDEPIKVGDIFIHPDLTIERASRDLDGRGLHKIIASTIPKVGKELKFSKYGKVLNSGVTAVNFNKEYEYTETENSIIINL